MNKIEDVIKAYECKKSIEDKCNECPYFFECDDKYHCECEARDNDVLHYLKEYRDDRENFSEAISNCGKALNKYIMDIHDLAQQEENLPLTWDELKQMEGKPVWVKFFYEDGQHFDSDWFLVGFVSESFCDVIGKLGTSRLVKNDYWQAYRKEQFNTEYEDIPMEYFENGGI